MKMHVSFALCVALLSILVGCGEPIEEPEDNQPLAGTWVGIHDAMTHSFRFHSTGFNYTAVNVGSADTVLDRGGTVTVDSSYTPRRIDFLVLRDLQRGYNQTLWEGVYDRQGDTLYIAVPDSLGDLQRPPNLEDGFVDWYSVLTLVYQQ